MKIIKDQNQTPAVIIAGWSGSGKTTFIEKLIPALKKRHLKVGTVKHHHAGLELDKPGKDTWRHRKAGADKTVITSPDNVGMMMTVDHEPLLEEVLPLMSDMDIVIIEGYKMEKQPKIEIFRSTVHEKPQFLDDPDLIAIVSDTEPDSPVPVFDLDNPDNLAEFIIRYFNL